MKTPYPFQLENVRAGLARHILIADDCGLGKTFSAVLLGVALQRRAMHGVPWRALVVCPKGVRFQWVKELNDLDAGLDVTVVDTGMEWPTTPRGWYITHYEALMAKPPYHVLWDYVVVDEAHRIKNRKALRTKAIKQLSSLKRVALTGTPMDKDPSELWSVLNWLYPSEFTSYWRFRQTYCLIGENYAGYPVVLGPRNMDHLAKVLRGRFLRHTKEQVVKDLPPRVHIDIPLQMYEAQAYLYDKIRRARDIEIQTPQGELLITNALARITRLQQVASAPSCLGDEFDVSSVKIDWVLEFVADHPELAVVVFTRFVRTAEIISELLTESGIAVDTFFGRTNTVPINFINGGSQVLVATIAKAGEGLDLKRANAAIFVDLEWSTIKMQQAYDRVHRLGIDAPKLIYTLQASPIDVLIAEAIEKKWDDAALVYQALQRQML